MSELADVPISIPSVAAEIERPFEPRDLVRVNDAVMRIAAIEGEFPWHHHDEDELFMCWDGAFRIELADREPVPLGTGEIYVVPKGAEHRPTADRRAVVLMLERPETLQYGN